MYVSDHSEGASSPFVNLTDNHWTHSTHSFQDKPIPVFSITFSSSDFPVSIVLRVSPKGTRLESSYGLSIISPLQLSINQLYTMCLALSNFVI